jgi:C_GCAxxG_C_C family probable redox protein
MRGAPAAADALDASYAKGGALVNRVDTAGRLFMEGNSCSQAVACAFASSVGLDPLDAMRLASGFGGGMRIGGTCGAATGAVLILGLAFDGNDDAESRKRVTEAIESFYASFLERVGATDCPAILGCDFRSPDGREFVDVHGLREARCLPAVQAAAQILVEMLEPGR